MCLADRFYCYWSVQKNHPLSKFEFQLSWHHGSCFLNVWCHKTGDSLFPPSDAGTQDAVCVSWTDLFMLLATVVRRDSSAAYPSVSAALGRRWRAFAGIQKFLFVCLQVTELFTVLCTAYIWHLRFHELYFKDSFFCRFQLQCIETVRASLGGQDFLFLMKSNLFWTQNSWEQLLIYNGKPHRRPQLLMSYHYVPALHSSWHL